MQFPIFFKEKEKMYFPNIKTKSVCKSNFFFFFLRMEEQCVVFILQIPGTLFVLVFCYY